MLSWFRGHSHLYLWFRKIFKPRESTLGMKNGFRILASNLLSVGTGIPEIDNGKQDGKAWGDFEFKL
jgi:hypothetical protein